MTPSPSGGVSARPVAYISWNACLLAWAVIALGWAGSGIKIPDRHQQWLDEEVRYLISEREAREFRLLTTEELRESFIERFWLTRDPDPSTQENEFRLRHLKRIKEANRKFSEAGPGWRSDRGRIYIMHGPPDSISFQVGGPMNITIQRPTNVLDQVASVTQTAIARITFQLPDSEVWVYRNIDGARHVSGSFQVIFSRINRSSLHSAAGSLGKMGRASTANYSQRVLRDTIITRFLQESNGVVGRDYELVYAGSPRFSGIGDLFLATFQNPQVYSFKFTDVILAERDIFESRGEVRDRRQKLETRLKEEVSSQVFFQELDIQLSAGTVKASRGRTVVPITFSLDRKYQGDTLDFLIELQRLDGERAAGLADSLALKGNDHDDFIYRTRLVARPGRYRLNLFAKLKRKRLFAHMSQEILLPDYSDDGLNLSDVLLFSKVVPRRRSAKGRETGLPPFLGASRPFALKDFWLVPAVEPRFRRRDNLTALIEVYNPVLAKKTPEPDLDLVCRFWQGNQVVATVPEKSLDYMTSTDVDSSHVKRTLYGISLPLRGFRPGRYRLELEVFDRLAGKKLSRTTEFVIR